MLRLFVFAHLLQKRLQVLGSHDASTGARGRRESVANRRNEAREGIAVRLRWRFIATKLAWSRAASDAGDRNAALL
jgi:hypothetical protein